MDRRQQGPPNVKDNQVAGLPNTKRSRFDDGPDQASSSKKTEPQHSVGNASSSSASQASAPSLSQKKRENLADKTTSLSPPRMTHPGVIENLAKSLTEKAAGYAAAGLDRDTCQRNSILDFGQFMAEMCQRHGTFDNFVAHLHATSPVVNDGNESDSSD